ncbi:chemotaxis protein CheB [Pseudomonas sp. TUM22785]|uniref:chemotaxis protein CheB n=1 Tax=Pseudomonas sp. TUM22785 TaxID=3019098 RepID=UPI002306BBCA|nr:chemotaxis protein CheB [Pseudomonas sp. TUM22785]WCD80108.1 chemotaxis protein CheB [Pseudomonas sp. TUM22785]
MSTQQWDAVVVGASAGGVEALLTVFNGLPADYALPLVCVLHLPESRDSLLADLFSRRLALRVKEAEDKESLRPGTLYFAAPGYHLSIERDRSLSFSREEPLHYSRPSIDVLFESAADCFQERLVGVLLTGANQDGAAGLAAIKQGGGLTVVQDPLEAQVPTMPEAALASHVPDHILPLRGIRALLAQLDPAHAD